MAGLLSNIDVPDREQGIAFYASALGPKVGRRFGPGFCLIEFNAEGYDAIVA